MPDRLIKESICTSDTLNQLTDFEERFWYRLLVNCDDYGRFDARPAILKGRLFPLRDGKTLHDMSITLNRLASVGLVDLYEVDGKPFLRVVTWERYQRIRAKRSKFPPPDGTCQQSADICCQMTAPDSTCRRNPIQSESNPNPIQDEGETRGRADAVAAVQSAFLDRINPTPSERCLTELAAYAEKMGAECCMRAFDVALDAKKTAWPYIRSILRAKAEQGVRCLADWDALEEQREKRQRAAQGGKGAKPGESTQPRGERIRKNADWLDRFLEGQEG